MTSELLRARDHFAQRATLTVTSNSWKSQVLLLSESEIWIQTPVSELRSPKLANAVIEKLVKASLAEGALLEGSVTVRNTRCSNSEKFVWHVIRANFVWIELIGR